MGDNIPNRNNWKFNKRIDKDYTLDELIDYYIGYMFSRTLQMFKWNDLPDGMNSYDVEKFTQLKADTFILYDNKKNRYFILEGSAYDNISWNYEPLKSIIVNPSLPELNKIKYELGKNAVMIRNDYLRIGLYPMLEKNAIDLANTDLSIKYASFNSRLKSVMTSDDDTTKASLDKVIDDVWNGRKPVSIVTNDLYKSSIDNKKYAEGNYTDIHQLIELKQYQLAHWYMELCINANYNMKSQYVNDGEMTMNDDALIPLIDQMLECRKMACKEMNKLFGLHVSVELNSSWKKKFDEIKRESKQQELENDVLEQQVENAEESNNEDSNDKGGEDNVSKDE